MHLDDVLKGQDALLHMERYVDEGTKEYSAFSARNEASAQYQPENDNPFFDLVTVKVPKDCVAVFQASPDAHLLDRYLRSKHVLFAVHPEIWGDNTVRGMGELELLPRGEPIRVCPTASTRTVFTSGEPGVIPKHYLKLHFPRCISRFDRRLRRVNIANSIAVTRDLASIRFEKFAYLRDTLGFTFGYEHDSWGFMVREADPVPSEGSFYLIPSFALYGHDIKNPSDLPLIVQLIDHSGEDPEDFLTEQIIVPVIDCWTRVARHRGILLESHAQNTLVEIDRNFRPGRIVHRDFDVWINGDFRRNSALEGNFERALQAEKGHAIEQHYSLVYDHFLGREFLDHLLACVRDFYAIDDKSVRARARQAFHDGFPDAGSFFPRDTTFYFSDGPSSDNQPALVDVGHAPEWR